jgi:hypothetical protein
MLDINLDKLPSKCQPTQLSPCTNVSSSHVHFTPFTVILVLATMELVAHDMHAYEMHAYGMHAYECMPMTCTPVRYIPVREAYRERHFHKRHVPAKDVCPRDARLREMVRWLAESASAFSHTSIFSARTYCSSWHILCPTGASVKLVGGPLVHLESGYLRFLNTRPE